MTETDDDLTESILQDIQDLQEGLEKLKLKVEQRRILSSARSENSTGNTPRVRIGTGPLQVGEEVVIRNPKKGQEKVGIVGKIHASGWITVNGWKRVNGARVEAKIKRIRTNLTRKQN